MSYMEIGNYRIRMNGKKVSLFDKVNEIKQHIKRNFPEINDKSILQIMSRCRRFYENKLYYGRKDSSNKRERQLSHIELAIYEYLIKEHINPSTAYRWFLACRLPSDVIDALKQGKINQKTAFSMSCNRFKNKKSQESLILLEKIREKVRGL